MKRASCAERGIGSAPWLLTALLALPGCSSSGAAPGSSSRPPAIDALLGEGQALGGLFGATHLLFLAAVVAAAVGLNALVQTLVRLAWRLGFDSDRSWARTAVLLRLLISLAAVVAVLRGAFGVAPVLTSVFALALAVGFVFLSGFVPNAFAGVGLIARRRIRAGDRVKVGTHEGVVREVGLAQLYLRGSDGSTVLVPNRLLNELPVVVERARNSVPVRVRLKLQHKPSTALIERLRQLALLSPYRAPDSLVDVARSPDDEYVVTVEIQAWSARAYRDARAQLESALRRELG